MVTQRMGSLFMVCLNSFFCAECFSDMQCEVDGGGSEFGLGSCCFIRHEIIGNVRMQLKLPLILNSM